MSPRSAQDNARVREQSRQQILLAALQAFAEKGYAAASMAHIAREAGVSKGLAYHYFDSKEDLLRGIFDMMVEESAQLHEGWDNKTPRQQLHQLITASLQYIRNHTDTMRFLISLSVQPAVVKDLEELMNRQREEMMLLYKQLFADLGYDDPDIEAYYLGALLDGTALGYLSLQNAYPLTQLEQKLLKKYQL